IAVHAGSIPPDHRYQYRQAVGVPGPGPRRRLPAGPRTHRRRRRGGPVMAARQHGAPGLRSRRGGGHPAGRGVRVGDRLWRRRSLGHAGRGRTAGPDGQLRGGARRRRRPAARGAPLPAQRLPDGIPGRRRSHAGADPARPRGRQLSRQSVAGAHLDVGAGTGRRACFRRRSAPAAAPFRRSAGAHAGSPPIGVWPAGATATGGAVIAQPAALGPASRAQRRPSAGLAEQLEKRPQGGDLTMSRNLICAASLAVLAAGAPWTQAAAAYPEKAITLIIGFAPGGPTDAIGRVLFKQVAEELRVPIVIENRPGAGGNIGAQEFLRAQPDGYTLMYGTSSITTAP